MRRTTDLRVEDRNIQRAKVCGKSEKISAAEVPAQTTNVASCRALSPSVTCRPGEPRLEVAAMMSEGASCPEPYLTPDEAAEYVRLHRRTITRAAQQGELRSVGSARGRRYRREWLDEWLEAKGAAAA